MSDEELKILFKNTVELPTGDFTDKVMSNIEALANSKKIKIFTPSFVYKYAVLVMTTLAILVYLIISPPDSTNRYSAIFSHVIDFIPDISTAISNANSSKLMLFMILFISGFYLLDRLILSIFKKRNKLMNV